MSWEISDLFPLVICQVRNHDANNDFSLWSDESISPAGALRHLLSPSTLRAIRYSISMTLRVEAHVCLMLLVSELYFLELLIFSLCC